MFDSVTILQTKGGLPLTKTFKAVWLLPEFPKSLTHQEATTRDQA